MAGSRPKRPRQHQIETESRIAFQRVIPTRWVYRDLNQDYGIDAEVEIFDEAGSATGLKFLVQLKATDEVDLRKALRLRLPEPKCNYYASLILPVLIARYHAPTGRFYVQWFHALDPYYGRKTKAGFSFQISDQAVWSDVTAAQIMRNVEEFSSIKSPRLRTPLSFSLILDGEVIHGIPAHAFYLSIRSAVREVSHIIKLSGIGDSASADPNTIVVSADKLEVNVGGMRGFSLHETSRYVGTDAAAHFQYDAMLGIGLALDWHGHSIEGAALIEPFWRRARIPKHLPTAFPLAICLARANRMSSALDIAEQYFLDDATIDAAQAYLFPVLSRQSSFTPSEIDFVARVFQRIANCVMRRGNGVLASTITYNCGSLLRSADRYREAVHLYRLAARADPAYLKRAYYWRELAGMLFLCRRYACASKAYKLSLELDNDKETRLLYADALMFSGRYRDAKDAFSEGICEAGRAGDVEWDLKLASLLYLIEMTGIGEQKRKSNAFPEEFKPSENNDPEIERVCIRSLASDALSAISWFNLGGVYHRRGDVGQATKCFLLSALIVPWDVESWGNVIALCLQSNDIRTLGDCLQVAYRTNGEAILLNVASRAQSKRSEFARLMAELVDHLPEQNKVATFRLHRTESTWDEFRSPSPAD